MERSDSGIPGTDRKVGDMEEKRRRGRPVTPYKVGVMVRVTPEAAEILKRQPNQSEFIDELIKQSEKTKDSL